MVEGLKRLERKLKRTIPAKAIAFTRKAMEQSADEIVAMMKRLVPVGRSEDRKAGRPAILETIDWTWGDAPAGAMVIGRSSRRADGLRITIYAGNERTMVQGRSQLFQLARLIEHGTQDMDAQPFFFVSWRALRRRAKSRISRQMRKGIKEGAA
ncbi:HK97 gp10 family phage protein [Aliihoeflea sp. 40Bstr573]|uniref:HK97 gp10 family phage protein n=1 Tax=Aliihoeflea sp. 40Bstr573 TaxID=2696467 RepID=UPI00209415BF|nr:HK97 gp10 family phage protein [Aliihoeflea sp. 40Bstr573]MCO6386354.1 HK97 gp10 family phage protein [Aliihoeflea sp. 40Bstr573]